MAHYGTLFLKHNKVGISHQEDIEKWIASFERFLSLLKLMSLWHKARKRKGTKIRKHFYNNY